MKNFDFFMEFVFAGNSFPDEEREQFRLYVRVVAEHFERRVPRERPDVQLRRVPVGEYGGGYYRLLGTCLDFIYALSSPFYVIFRKRFPRHSINFKVIMHIFWKNFFCF